jgi:glutamate racemase
VTTDNRPIGIYDSGIGGLTVLSEVRRKLPHESVIYYGDTTHLPYGNKTKDTLISYNKHIFKELTDNNCKMIISACNASSALALDAMRDDYPQLPIIGLIQPGARAALAASRHKNIGIIATEATVKSDAYHHAIKELDQEASVRQVACPEFVPLVEQGKIDSLEALTIVNKYLSQLLDVDTLVYGCTHYPYLETVIKLVVPQDQMAFIDPAQATVEVASKQLASLNISASEDNQARYRFIWSGKEPKPFNASTYLAMDLAYS